MVMIDIENIKLPYNSSEMKDLLYANCRGKQIKGPYKILIDVYTCKNPYSIVKAVLYTLKHKGCISSDSEVRSFNFFKFEIKPGQPERVKVAVFNIGEFYGL